MSCPREEMEELRCRKYLLGQPWVLINNHDDFYLGVSYSLRCAFPHYFSSVTHQNSLRKSLFLFYRQGNRGSEKVTSYLDSKSKCHPTMLQGVEDFKVTHRVLAHEPSLPEGQLGHREALSRDTHRTWTFSLSTLYVARLWQTSAP